MSMRCYVLILLALAALGAPGLRAEITYLPNDPAAETAFEALFGNTSRRTWNDGVTLRSLVGPTLVVPGSLTSPDKILDELAPFLGVDAKNLLPDTNRTVKSEDQAHYEFYQVADDHTRVENTLLIVDVARDRSALAAVGRLIGVASQLVPKLQLPTFETGISQEAAKCIAVSSFLRSPACADDSLDLEAFPTVFAVSFVARPAWVVELRQTGRHASRRYVIDRTNGAILEQRDRSHKAALHGQIFNPTPFIDSTVHSYVDVVPTSHAYEEIDPLTDVSYANGFFRLANKNVLITDLDQVDDVKSTDGDFDFLRGSVEFASVMAYHHINLLEQYAFAVPGLKPGRALPVDVRNDDESEYMNDPAGAGYILFKAHRAFLGSGPIDFFDAEDGDVVAHECGHAIQSSQADGRYDVDPTAPSELMVKWAPALAMSEGFADFWAMSYFEKQKVEHGLTAACLGQWKERWDGYSLKECDRRVNLAAVYDKDFDPYGDVYKNASVWTATLWDIRRQLGKSVADAIIVRSHLSVPDTPSFLQGAQAIFTADDALYLGQSHGTALCDIFVHRKIIVKDDCKP
jgi:Zn-dependent metalloprotease